MACTRFEYVKDFEEEHRILKNCWFVIRIDGRRFTEFCTRHQFEKPNDNRCIKLMNRCAKQIMKSFGDIIMAYGHSDEYSFVFKRDANIWNRRETKIVTNLVSLFTSCFVFYWNEYFSDMSQPLYPPSFDGRVVCYPTDQNLRDYLSWRQADCHINNQYNVLFWSLVNIEKMSKDKACELLRGTLTCDKNEMLFSKFGINYNDLHPLYRKGTILIRIPQKFIKEQSTKKMATFNQQDNEECGRLVEGELIREKGLSKESNRIDNNNNRIDISEGDLPIPSISGLMELNVDIIREQFWKHFWFLIPSSNDEELK